MLFFILLQYYYFWKWKKNKLWSGQTKIMIIFEMTIKIDWRLTHVEVCVCVCTLHQIEKKWKQYHIPFISHNLKIQSCILFSFTPYCLDMNRFAFLVINHMKKSTEYRIPTRLKIHFGHIGILNTESFSFIFQASNPYFFTKAKPKYLPNEEKKVFCFLSYYYYVCFFSH